MVNNDGSETDGDVLLNLDILIDNRLIVILMTFLQNLRLKPGILERFSSEIGVCYIPINVYAIIPEARDHIIFANRYIYSQYDLTKI